MLRKILFRASAASYALGSVLCLAHLILSWNVIIRLGAHEPDAQWQIVWLVFFPFDFPFSLLVFPGSIIFPSWSFPLRYPLGEFRSFILPSIVHGIIGPLWYFFIPVFTSGIWSLLRERTTNATKHEGD